MLLEGNLLCFTVSHVYFFIGGMFDQPSVDQPSFDQSSYNQKNDDKLPKVTFLYRIDG